MVDNHFFDIFNKNSIDKQMVIETEDKTVRITNTELHSQEFEMTESLCSEEELRFGCCEASVVKFKISNVFTPLTGKWINISMVLDRNPENVFNVGRYKVFSDVPTADRKCREVTAYDAMYDIINADVADWYNEILPSKENAVTLKKFRTSFFEHFGLEQENVSLINDDMIVEKTIEPSEISGKDVITAICEINGCFGHIGRNGKFKYVYLPKYINGLYPSDNLYPSNDIYPLAGNAERIGKSSYINCKYEDVVTKEITKLQIRQEENDIGEIIGNGDNCYIIEDNFIVYGKTGEELERIGKRIYNQIQGVSFRPFSAECIGNMCFEVGDAVRIPTRYDIVESYILKRTLKGIQALRDTYSSEGKEYYSEKMNSVKRSIIQLKGKTNMLERDAEQTKSTITDVGERLHSQITQVADSVAITISEKGDVVSGLTVDKNGIGFVGNYLVIDTKNLKLDEDGNVDVLGNITARDGISLEYRNTYVKPNVVRVFRAIDVGYDQFESGGLLGTPYLNMYAPSETLVMSCGSVNYTEMSGKLKLRDTPVFPNGALIQSAWIDNLHQTYYDITTLPVGGDVATILTIRARKSGAFVSVYGVYNTALHAAGEEKSVPLHSFEEAGVLPTHQGVRAVGFYGERPFEFVITTDGRFVARNRSDSGINRIDAEPAEIRFRFDYFLFD